MKLTRVWVNHGVAHILRPYSELEKLLPCPSLSLSQQGSEQPDQLSRIQRWQAEAAPHPKDAWWKCALLTTVGLTYGRTHSLEWPFRNYNKNVILDIWQQLKNWVWAVFLQMWMLLNRWNRQSLFIHEFLLNLSLFPQLLQSVSWNSTITLQSESGLASGRSHYRPRPQADKVQIFEAELEFNFWSRIRVSYIRRQGLKSLRRQ